MEVSDAEGHESDDVVVRFRVSLDRAAPNAVTVRYETVDGTALAGEDYEAMSGELTFAAGETEKWVEVALVDDTVEDGGETFGLRLTSVTGAVLGDAEGVGTILNTEALNVEAPAFAESGYVFELAENADGSALPVALGAVSATDPEGSAVGYSIVGGNDAGLFAIDASTGALIYVGSGEDYESGTRSHALTVRASDGTLHSDVAVTVNLTDVVEVDPNFEPITVSVSEPTRDDFPANTTTNGQIAVGGFVTGRIEAWLDRDWFAVTLEAGKKYQFDLKGYLTNDGTLHNPMLSGIYDSDGKQLPGTASDGGGFLLNARVYFTAPETDTYYVAARGVGGMGTYKLLVTDTTVPDDFSASTDTAGTVPVGGSATGEIGTAQDVDWFAVTLEAGMTYQFDLKGSWTDDGTLGNPVLRGVHDENGNLIADTRNDNGGTGSNSRLTFTAWESGTYYIAADGRENQEGTYTLSVKKAPSKSEPEGSDAPADTTTTYRVAVDGSATGKIEVKTEQDWFAVTLLAGTTYKIEMKSWWDDSNAGTLLNPYLRGIYDSDGNLIPGTTNNNYGNTGNSLVRFTPTESGTYFVAAASWWVEVDETNPHWLESSRWWREGIGSHNSALFTGTYTLYVTDATDDYSATTGTTGVVQVGGSARGEVEFEGDRDWFAVTLELGKTYQFDMKGSVNGHGTIMQPVLHGIHDADGNRIDATSGYARPVQHVYVGNNNFASDGSRNYRTVFTATEDGTYYVAAGGPWIRDGQVGRGTYELSVTDISAEDDFAAWTTTTGTVTVGGSATGEIEETDDRDWFAVTLEGGKTYRIDLEGRHTEAGTLEDPVLHGVHDANGNRIDDTKDVYSGVGSNAQLIFTPTESGTYHIVAGGVGRVYIGGGGDQNTGTYKLTVTDAVTDDYPATTATTGVVAVDGSVRGEIEKPGDRDWFAVTLEAGKTYQIDLKGSRYVDFDLRDISDGTLRDPYLHGIYDSDGDLLAHTGNDDGGTGRDSLVTFTAPESDTYYIAARGGFSGEHHIGTYTLLVTDVTDDFAVTTATTGAVEVDGSATGVIDKPGDRDWFAVALEADKTYLIDLKGTETGDGTLDDPYLLGIRDENGDLIDGTANDNGGEGNNARVTLTATESGTYYFDASGAGNSTGTYTLAVEEVM